MYSLRQVATFCNSYFTRQISTTSSAMKAYEQWPYKKFRRIGRRPSYWKGQGGRKSRIPYDKRYEPTGKDINETVEGLRRGGNEVMRKQIGVERARHNPATLNYYDYEKERDMVEMIPEMIPEFVVPDLTSFELKPYVSYHVGEFDLDPVPVHSAATLYKHTYEEEVIEKVKS